MSATQAYINEFKDGKGKGNARHLPGLVVHCLLDLGKDRPVEQVNTGVDPIADKALGLLNVVHGQATFAAFSRRRRRRLDDDAAVEVLGCPSGRRDLLDNERADPAMRRVKRFEFRERKRRADVGVQQEKLLVMYCD